MNRTITPVTTGQLVISISPTRLISARDFVAVTVQKYNPNHSRSGTSVTGVTSAAGVTSVDGVVNQVLQFWKIV